MNDKEIIKINREFLKHDYNTDVIAFDYGNSFLMEGEVYMSLETIKVNAINYKVSFRKELLRVMIHGTLHLCGFNDSTENERRTMKKKEDEWLLKMVRI